MVYDLIAVLQLIFINVRVSFQKICRKKLKWDEEITRDLEGEWKRVLNTL